MCECGKITTDEGSYVVHEHLGEFDIRIGNIHNTFIGLWMTDDFKLTERPKDCKEAYVLRWDDMGIKIPWPLGLTALEAVELWREIGLC